MACLLWYRYNERYYEEMGDRQKLFVWFGLEMHFNREQMQHL